jgi:hypothetical protein
MAFALPSTHYIVISRGIVLKGLTLADLWSEAIILLVMGLLAVAASISLYSKKIG